MSDQPEHPNTVPRNKPRSRLSAATSASKPQRRASLNSSALNTSGASEKLRRLEEQSAKMAQALERKKMLDDLTEQMQMALMAAGLGQEDVSAQSEAIEQQQQQQRQPQERVSAARGASRFARTDAASPELSQSRLAEYFASILERAQQPPETPPPFVPRSPANAAGRSVSQSTPARSSSQQQKQPQQEQQPRQAPAAARQPLESDESPQDILSFLNLSSQELNQMPKQLQEHVLTMQSQLEAINEKQRQLQQVQQQLEFLQQLQQSQEGTSQSAGTLRQGANAKGHGNGNAGVAQTSHDDIDEDAIWQIMAEKMAMGSAGQAERDEDDADDEPTSGGIDQDDLADYIGAELMNALDISASRNASASNEGADAANLRAMRDRVMALQAFVSSMEENNESDGEVPSDSFGPRIEPVASDSEASMQTPDQRRLNPDVEGDDESAPMSEARRQELLQLREQLVDRLAQLQDLQSKIRDLDVANAQAEERQAPSGAQAQKDKKTPVQDDEETSQLLEMLRKIENNERQQRVLEAELERLRRAQTEEIGVPTTPKTPAWLKDQGLAFDDDDDNDTPQSIARLLRVPSSARRSVRASANRTSAVPRSASSENRSSTARRRLWQEEEAPDESKDQSASTSEDDENTGDDDNAPVLQRLASLMERISALQDIVAAQNAQRDQDEDIVEEYMSNGSGQAQGEAEHVQSEQRQMTGGGEQDMMRELLTLLTTSRGALQEDEEEQDQDDDVQEDGDDGTSVLNNISLRRRIQTGGDEFLPGRVSPRSGSVSVAFAEPTATTIGEDSDYNSAGDTHSNGGGVRGVRRGDRPLRPVRQAPPPPDGQQQQPPMMNGWLGRAPPGSHAWTVSDESETRSRSQINGQELSSEAGNSSGRDRMHSLRSLAIRQALTARQSGDTEEDALAQARGVSPLPQSEGQPSAPPPVEPSFEPTGSAGPRIQREDERVDERHNFELATSFAGQLEETSRLAFFRLFFAELQSNPTTAFRTAALQFCAERDEGRSPGAPDRAQPYTRDDDLQDDDYDAADISAAIAERAAEEDAALEGVGADRLRSIVFHEASSFIAENDRRPDYLAQLFRLLRALGSDYQRQHALYSLHRIVASTLHDDTLLSARAEDSDTVQATDDADEDEDAEQSFVPDLTLYGKKIRDFAARYVVADGRMDESVDDTFDDDDDEDEDEGGNEDETDDFDDVFQRDGREQAQSALFEEFRDDIKANEELVAAIRGLLLALADSDDENGDDGTASASAQYLGEDHVVAVLEVAARTVQKHSSWAASVAEDDEDSEPWPLSSLRLYFDNKLGQHLSPRSVQSMCADIKDILYDEMICNRVIEQVDRSYQAELADIRETQSLLKRREAELIQRRLADLEGLEQSRPLSRSGSTTADDASGNGLEVKGKRVTLTVDLTGAELGIDDDDVEEDNTEDDADDTVNVSNVALHGSIRQNHDAGDDDDDDDEDDVDGGHDVHALVRDMMNRERAILDSHVALVERSQTHDSPADLPIPPEDSDTAVAGDEQTETDGGDANKEGADKDEASASKKQGIAVEKQLKDDSTAADAATAEETLQTADSSEAASSVASGPPSYAQVAAEN